mgnify:CR=1 FL=1
MTVVYYPTIQYNTEILRLAIAGTERNIHMQQRTKNRIIVTLMLAFIFISGILLGIFGERFFAASRVTDYGRTKYYAFYMVRRDDTLWTIADDLMPYNPEYQDVRQYVEEIRRLNNIPSDGKLISGTSLLIPYYFNENAMDQAEAYARYNIGILKNRE